MPTHAVYLGGLTGPILALVGDLLGEGKLQTETPTALWVTSGEESG